MNKYFEVDLEGLAQLYANKPKTFIINELVQNCWDENIIHCSIRFKYNIDDQQLSITVEDDSPEGFKVLEHAYTLYADTYKRRDPTKRGRFNLGEKQVIAVCLSKKNQGNVTISTTKGLIIFDSKGRSKFPAKRKVGSEIYLEIKATIDEYNELREHAKTLLVPKHIKYTVDGVEIKPSETFKTFTAKLFTEILEGEVMKCQTRETKINLIESNGQSYIYEMGIPIIPTDCSWHVDVQQKIQLNIDRDNILPSYLQDLYAEVLNNTYTSIEEPSALWVRTGMKDKRATPEAIKGIMTQRFGDKFCIANPLDKKSMEEAISKGYNVIYGGEMSKEEWAITKDNLDIESTSQLFGHRELVDAEVVTPSDSMLQMALYIKGIASQILNIKIDVSFANAPTSHTVADYDSDNRVMRFNVAHTALKSGFFENPTGMRPTKLIIHELAHENGGHIDYNYQDKCCEIGAKLKDLALKDPKFFEVKT